VLVSKSKLYANAVDATLRRMYRDASFTKHQDSVMDFITALTCLSGFVVLPLMVLHIVRTAKPISEMTPEEIEMHQDLTAI
jgi:hypothetical protein